MKKYVVLGFLLGVGLWVNAMKQENIRKFNIFIEGSMIRAQTKRVSPRIYQEHLSHPTRALRIDPADVQNFTQQRHQHYREREQEDK